MQKTSSGTMQTLQPKEGAINSLENKIARLENAAANEERVRKQTITNLQRTLGIRQNEIQMIRQQMDEQNKAGMESQQQLYVFFQQSLQAKQAEMDQIKETINAVNQEAAGRMTEVGQEIDELSQGEECDDHCVIL